MARRQPNVRDEVRRVEDAEHENKTESRRRLQHVCWAAFSWVSRTRDHDIRDRERN
jgi:hypothetical protein